MRTRRRPPLSTVTQSGVTIGGVLLCGSGVRWKQYRNKASLRHLPKNNLWPRLALIRCSEESSQTFIRGAPVTVRCPVHQMRRRGNAPLGVFGRQLSFMHHKCDIYIWEVEWQFYSILHLSFFSQLNQLNHTKQKTAKASKNLPYPFEHGGKIHCNHWSRVWNWKRNSNSMRRTRFRGGHPMWREFWRIRRDEEISVSLISLSPLRNIKLTFCSSSEKYPKCAVIITKVDIALEAEVDEWIATAVKTFGRLDGAANVAGLSKRQLDTTTANIVRNPILLENYMLIIDKERIRLGHNGGCKLNRNNALHARSAPKYHSSRRIYCQCEKSILLLFLYSPIRNPFLSLFSQELFATEDPRLKLTRSPLAQEWRV